MSCSYFPVINSVSNRISSLLVLHPILCFLGRFIWSKSPLLSLPELIFTLSKYNCHHPVQIKSNQINLCLCDVKKYHDCHRRKGGLQKTTWWTMLHKLT